MILDILSVTLIPDIIPSLILFKEKGANNGNANIFQKDSLLIYVLDKCLNL